TRSTPEPLTQRQREVLALVMRGHTNTEIAEQLGISLAGAKWHVSELLDRYDVATHDELIASVEAQRAPRARLRHLAAGLAGLVPGKAVATLVGGVFAGLATGLIVVIALTMRESGAPAAVPPTPSTSPHSATATAT